MNQPGSVTQKDIAARLGLSIKAVSMGLSGTGRLNPATREKIRETAVSLGYVPNAAARALVTHRSNFLGVLVPYANFSFFGNIIAGMEEAAAEQGYSLLLDSLHKNPTRRRQAIASLVQRGVDGIILYPERDLLPLAPQVSRLNLPVVQIMNSFPDFGPHAVTVDNYDGARQATEHLIGQGYQAIGMIAHDQESPELQERHRGFLDTIAQLRTGQQAPVVQSAIDFQDAYKTARQFLSDHPTLQAIFAASDVAALATVRAALDAGRRIPQDLAVIGFDNLDIAAHQLEHPLTTIDQPKEQIGRLAATMCLKLISGQSAEAQSLTPPLIVRQTT